MVSKGEKLRLCGLDPHFRSAFATTRLDRLFDIADEETGALKTVTIPSPLFAEKAIF